MKKTMTVVLASTSPRRIDLLTQARVPIEVIAPGADEARRAGESPKAMVRRLALDKAKSVAEEVGRLFGRAVIISADTIVVAPNGKTVLGKPKDVAHARKMLRMLAGKQHTVWTGYCLLPVGESKARKPLVRAIASKVRMRKLSAKDIEAYIRSGEPMDKAGSYAAQGIGMALIEGLEGSYTNVVGLPICQVLQDLELEYGVALFPT